MKNSKNRITKKKWQRKSLDNYRFRRFGKSN